MKHVLSLLLSALFCISLSGCNESIEHTKYEYKTMDYYLESVDYTDNELTLSSYSVMFDNIDSLQCLDSNQKLVKDFTYVAEGKHLIISSENAEKITGVEFTSENDKYMFRYLNTSQYAYLHYISTEDIGYMLVDGVEDRFFTVSEKKSFDNRIKDDEERRELLFTRFEGKWICESDPKAYLVIYIDSNGERAFGHNLLSSDNKYSFYNMPIVDIYSREGT